MSQNFHMIRVLISCAAAAVLSTSAFADTKQKDVAPIDSQVIDLIGKAFTSPSDDQLQPQLLQHLATAESVLSSIVAAKNLSLSEAQRMQLLSLLAELDVVHTEAVDRFAEMRARFPAAGENKGATAWKLKGGSFEAKYLQLVKVLKDVLEAKTSGQIGVTSAKAIKDVSDLRQKSLIHAGFDSLPSQPNITQQILPDVEYKFDVNRAPAPQYMSARNTSDRFVAFRGDGRRQLSSRDGFIKVAAPQPVPAAATTYCASNSADLAATADVVITPEISALAEQLSYSPAKIFKYVSNEVKFEPYFGSLKGSLGTLYSKSGGPTDQSSLLIALLRASNIPARFVQGIPSFADDPRVLRWFGVKSYQALTAVMKAGRYTGFATTTTADGRPKIIFSHVWVEACVPYGNYRGTGVDASGFRWVPMDPSFKEREYQDGIQVNVSFDYANYMSKRSNELPYELYETQVEAASKSLPPRYSNNTLQDIPYLGRDVPTKFDVLPVTLPYPVEQYTAWQGATVAEIASLPDAHRYKLNLSFANGAGTALMSPLVLSMPDIALKRTTLSFVGATSTDQTNLAAWQNDGNSSSAMPCTINVVPAVRIDGGSSVATGTVPIGLCTTDNKVTLSITRAEDTQSAGVITPAQTFTSVGGADYYAVNGFAFQTSDRLLTERAQRLLASVKSTSNPNTNLDETVGEYLNVVGLKLMRYGSDSLLRIGVLDGGTGLSGNHYSLVGTKNKVQYLFDLPFAVSHKTLNAQFAFDIRNLDLTTGLPSWKTFELAAYSASALNSYIWQENARTDAISGVRGLQYAREKGVPVLDVTSGNTAVELSKLTSNADATTNYPQAWVNDISSKVGAGYTVTVPRQTFAYQDWNGSAWSIKLNSPTGYSMAFVTGTNNQGASSTGGGATVGASQDTRYVYITSSGFSYKSTTIGNTTTTSVSVNSAVGSGVTTYSTVSTGGVNLVNGNRYHPERDISIPGRGLPLVFERSYNSRAAVDGPLGYGWTHSYNHSLKFNDANSNGVTDAADSDGITSSITWTDGSGSQKFIDVIGTSDGVANGSPLTAPSGFYFQASRNSDGTYSVREKNGLTDIFESVAGTVGQVAKLSKIVDRNGNTVSLTYSGSALQSVKDSLNRALTFTYSGSRIASISDWTGRTHQYGYDGTGNLTSYKNPLAVAGTQNPMTYAYYSATDGANLDHAMKSYTLPLGNGMTYEYYSNGKLFRQYNTKKETTTYAYNEFRRETVVTNERGLTKKSYFDANGMPIKTIDENGSVTINEYDPSNPFLKISTRSAMGYTARFAYDNQGNVTKVTNPSGNTIESFNYNAFGQPGKAKDLRGNYAINKFDVRGNLQEVIALRSGVGAGVDPTTYVPIAADVVSWSINTYDTYGNGISAKQLRDFTNKVGPSIEYDYNDTVNNVQGLHPVKVTRRGDKNGDGVIAASEYDAFTFTYDNLGRETQGVSKTGYATQSTYDALDRVMRGSDPNGKLRDYAFDANGSPTKSSLTIGGVLIDQVASTYDQSDRVATVADAGGFITKNTYDAAGNKIQITNPDNYSLGFTYDAANRPVMAYDEEGLAIYTTRDLDGKVRTITDPNNITTRKEYYGPEKDGRLKQTIDAIGRTTTYDYDANGNKTITTDSRGGTSMTAYDELNRPVRVVGPQYADVTFGSVRPVTKYTYNALGSVTALAAGRTDSTGTNQGSDVVATQMSFVYDDFGRKIWETDALGKSRSFEYDSYGNTVKTTDAKGQIQAATYGYGGVLATQTAYLSATDPAPKVTTYTRDDLSQVTQVQGPVVTYTNTYDAAHRLKTVTDSRGNKTLTYTYSSAGRLKTLQDGDGRRTDYLRDPKGRLTGVWAPNNDIVSFLYDNGGRLTEKWFPNGVNSRYYWNDDSSMRQLVNRTYTGTAVSQNEYSYDSLGNRATATEKAGAYTTPAQSQAFGYDPLNNLIYKTDGGSTNYYIYDLANQLKEIRQSSTTGTLLTALVYDGNGNLIQKCEGGTVTTSATSCTGTTVTGLSYDVYNRLTQVTKTGLSTQTYQYDHLGRRVSKTVGGTTTNYLYDGDDMIAEYGAWTSASAVYVHGPNMDDPIIRIVGTAGQYFHQDGLGSVVALTDSTSATLGSQLFDAWGNRLASVSTGSIAQYGYTGREPDETGLIYYRARYYDPSIGRFTQRDPSGFEGGLNLYAYVSDNPVNSTDPTGLWEFDKDYWVPVGLNLLSLGNNFFGAGVGTIEMVAGVALFAVPSPGITQAGGAVTFTVGLASFLNTAPAIPNDLVNLWNAVEGTPTEYANSGAGMLADRFYPGDIGAKAVADTVGLGLAVFSGRVPVSSQWFDTGSALAQYRPANANKTFDFWSDASGNGNPGKSAASWTGDFFGLTDATSKAVDWGQAALGSYGYSPSSPFAGIGPLQSFSGSGYTPLGSSGASNFSSSGVDQSGAFTGYGPFM